jgi:cell wall-associated NlpC family hydrolase
MIQLDKVISTAKAEVGTLEVPVNKTKYGKWYGLDGQPWCAMFVSWCFAQANATALIAQSPKGYAGCESFETWAKAKGLTVPVSDVQAGDILLFDFSHAGKSEHTGIALGYNKNTHLIDSVEGNTGGSNTGSQSNGDGVYLKHRAPSTVRYVVRPKWSK